jgi:DNA-binding transcriptional LysR family regulator
MVLLAFNDIAMMRKAALDGFGLVNLPLDYVGPHVANEKLIRVLRDWCPGISPLLSQPQATHRRILLFVEEFRYRGS